MVHVFYWSIMIFSYSVMVNGGGGDAVDSGWDDERVGEGEVIACVHFVFI